MTSPFDIHKKNHCPKCFQYLKPLRGKDGYVYIRCFTCNFTHYLDVEPGTALTASTSLPGDLSLSRSSHSSRSSRSYHKDQRVPRTQTTTLPSPTQPILSATPSHHLPASQASSQLPAVAGLQNRKRNPCAFPSCTSTRVAAGCSRSMCKVHCESNGGCSYAGGHLDRSGLAAMHTAGSSTTSRAPYNELAIRTGLPPSLQTPIDLTCSPPLAKLPLQPLSNSQFLFTFEDPTQDNEADQSQDIGLGIFNADIPSEQLAHRDYTPVIFNDLTDSVQPTYVDDCDLSIPSATALEECRATSPLPSVGDASAYQGKRRATSPLPEAGPSKRPAYTTQMSEAWTREERSVYLSQQDTDAVYRQEHQRLLTQRFILVYWDSDTSEATTRYVQVPKNLWRYWSFTELPSILSADGDESFVPPTCFELYNLRLCRWMQILPTHTVELHTDDHVYVRRRGVSICRDADRLFSDSTVHSKDPHIRFNIHQERAAVRLALKQSSRLKDYSTDYLLLPLSSLGAVSPSISAASSPSILPFSPMSSPEICVTETITSAPPIDSTDALCESFQAISPPPCSSIWPPPFIYVVDIVDSFERMDALAATIKKQKAQFKIVFGSTFVGSTYYDNRKRWNYASEPARQAAINAGRTPQGYWSTFAFTQPLRQP
ncbi:hypothetical protein EW146_g9761 [Bondarzewia mesenterica]|uniref:Uncharacterized protein n=1 Tax=Bondarzewia mesenterica TaxID=1095465 RepID=A0A4S4L5E7_9AGAM|nr:hypothetical protein EW146_g9761 [Bondarzewia mesenterica]